MNKRGTMALVYLMMGTLFFVIGLALADPLNDTVKGVLNGEGEGNYQCDNETSYQGKAQCTSIEIISPVFIGLIFGMAGIVIGRIAL